jgi:hypothetical protein
MYFIFISYLFSFIANAQIEQIIEKQGEIIIELNQNNLRKKYLIKYKNEKVRLDFIAEEDENINSLLINLADNSVFELNNVRKSYRAVNTNLYTISVNNLSLKKENSTTNFQGYDCEKWLITNNLNQTKIEYKIVKNKDFEYIKNVLKYIDKENIAFSALDALSSDDGIFPVSIIEYDKKGSILMNAKISILNNKKIDDSYFKIPSGFKAW